MSKLKEFIKTSSEKENDARQTKSSSGKLSRPFWNYPSDDLFGIFSTKERLVKAMEE